MSNQTKAVAYAGLLALTFSAGSVHATAEHDDDGPSSGDYRVVINQTCVRTPFQAPPAAGFDPATRQLLVEGESLTAIGSGLLRFARDGSVTLLDGVQTEVSLDQVAAGNTPVTPPAKFSCAGNYSVWYRKVSLSLSCEVPVQPGVKVTVGPQKFEGYFDRSRRSINLTNITGGIQTITVAVDGVPVQQRQRICTQHAIATR
jgi:hypothetical protein